MSCTRRFVTAIPMMFALSLLANRHHCTLMLYPLRFAEAERVHCRWAMLGAAGVLAQVGMHLHVRIDQCQSPWPTPDHIVWPMPDHRSLSHPISSGTSLAPRSRRHLASLGWSPSSSGQCTL